MKYLVELYTHTRQTASVEVEANSPAEAEQQAFLKCSIGEVHWSEDPEHHSKHHVSEVTPRPKTGEVIR